MMTDNYKIAFSNFRNQYFTAEELIGEKESGHLQTSSRIFSSAYSDWSVEQKSRFIESLIVGQPHPAFFIDGSLDKWYLIDGGKRLRALYQFVTGRYELQSLYFLGDMYENKSYSKLPLFIRRKIMNYQFEAYILNPGTSAQVRYGVYMNLLARPRKNISNECRLFIFAEGFEVLGDICRPLKSALQRRKMSYFSSSHNCTAEELAGRLFVFLLYWEGVAFEDAKSVNVEILVNSLLETPQKLSGFIDVYSLGRLLESIVDKIGSDTLAGIRDVREIDVILAVMAVLLREKKRLSQNVDWGERIDKIWQNMPYINECQGYLLGNYLNRYQFVYQNL